MKAANEAGWGVGDEILVNLRHMRSRWPERWRAAPLYYLRTTGSTNDDAWSLARAGAPEGTAVVAEEQASGRGRRGRHWFSPPSGLWMSVVLRPAMEASAAPLLTMACAVGAAWAVAKCTGLHCGLKWPNDLVLDGRKVGGVLVESMTAGAELSAAVAGFGVNVNQPASALPREIRGTATSLCEHTQREVCLADLAGTVLRELEECIRRVGRRANRCETAWLTAEYASLDVLSGKRVRVHQGGRIVQGLCRGVDGRGFLLIEDTRGEHAILWCDSVTVVEAAGR